MPMMAQSDYDDDDLGFGGAIETSLPPNSAQRDQRTTTGSMSIESTTLSVETEDTRDKRIEEDDESIAEDTAYEEILSEAREHFSGTKKPDFVVSAPKHKTKMVDMGKNQTAEITFTSWGGQGCGFWTLENNWGEKFIVKFFAKGRCYRQWQGVDDGFAEDPIAWPENARKQQKPSTTGHSASIADSEADSDGEARLDNKNMSSDDDQDEGTRSGLRKKSWSQLYPYAADKETFAAVKQGKVKPDIDARHNKESPTKSLKRKRQASSQSATPARSSKATQKASKSRRSRSSTANRSDTTALDPEAFKAHIMDKTTLRTTLPSDPDAIPLFLSKCPEVKSFWDQVVSAWSSEIEGTVQSMSVKFPWLGPEYNIKLKPELASSYDKMIEEIRENPCWEDGTDRCSVDIVLNID